MFADVTHSTTPKEVERNLHALIDRYSGASTLFLFDDLSDQHAAAYASQHNGTIGAVQRFGRLLAMQSN